MAEILDGMAPVVSAAAWLLVYALPWGGAFLVGRWAWWRVSPRSAFAAWAVATCVALGALLVLSMLLVAVIEVVAPST